MMAELSFRVLVKHIHLTVTLSWFMGTSVQLLVSLVLFLPCKVKISAEKKPLNLLEAPLTNLFVVIWLNTNISRICTI